MKTLQRPFVVIVVAVLLASCARGAPPAPTAAPTAAPAATPGAAPAPAFSLNGERVIRSLRDLNLRHSDQEGVRSVIKKTPLDWLEPGDNSDQGLLADAYRARAAAVAAGGAWQAAGPAPIDGVYLPQGRIVGSGRINGIAVDPRDSNVVYVAAAAGGLWKTTDGGGSWRSLTDGQAPAFYGGVLLDPSDPDVVYVPLGVFEGVESVVYGYMASGILRSSDGGETWKSLGQSTFNASAVSALRFDGRGNLYAASGINGVRRALPGQSEFGIFKSPDRGESWERLLSCGAFADCDPPAGSGLVSREGGFMDLDLASSGTLYTTLCEFECAGTHVLRSRDGGAQWEELSYASALREWENAAGTSILTVDNKPDMPYVEGLSLAVAPGDPNVLLMGGGVYVDSDGAVLPWSLAMRSTDGGDTWEPVESGDYCTGGGASPQCTYDNVVEIDPNDSKVMYLGGSFSQQSRTYHWIKVFRRSTDGGDTWSDLSSSTPANTVLHPDAHALAFDLQNPEVVWVGTDGGVARTRNAGAESPSWENLSQGLNTMLVVGIGLHPTDPDYIIAGLQDNGNAFTRDGGQTWTGASTGDAGYSLVDPFKPNIVYSHYPSYQFSRNSKGGEGGWKDWSAPGGAAYTRGLDGNDHWLFYPPMVVDPNTEGVLYFASNRVYKTTNRGNNWAPASEYLTRDSIRTLAIAPSDSRVLYAGTTDGRAFVTLDGGGEWSEVTGAFPPRMIGRIAVDPQDAHIAYVVMSGFDRQTLDRGHIFKTMDAGASWRDISFNLPDAPLGAAAVDVRPKYAGVYVGGAAGVWVLPAGSSTWKPYGTGMPNAIVSDLELNPKTGIMAAATFGRSVWVMKMP